jgi:hypothetical protein
LGTSLHDLVATIKETCPIIAEYYPPEELVLYASALLQGRPPTNATYMGSDFGERMLNDWDSLVEGIRRVTSAKTNERA